MGSHCRVKGLVGSAAIAAVVFMVAGVSAADRAKGFARFDPTYETVDLFPGIESGQIDVRMVPKDSTYCRLLIENKTEQPLNVRLPDVLAGVPVLPQFATGLGNGMNGGASARGNNKGNNTNAPQALGAGVGNQGGNRGNNPGNPAMFSLAPEGVGQLGVACVCLEYGKPTPRPVMPYQVQLIDRATAKVEVHELCRMLGQGDLDQNTAQAAVWHLNNDMSWKELAAKRVQSETIGWTAPLFTPREIANAKKAVDTVRESLKDREKSASSSVSMK